MKKFFKLVSVILIVALFSLLALTLTSCKSDDGRYYIEKDTRFSVESTTSVMNLPVMVVLDSKETYIDLRADGTMTMRFQVASGILNLVKLLFDIDLGEMIEGTDVTEFVEYYAKPLFPGFTLDDIPYSLSLMEKSIGVKITGIDFEDDDIIELCNSLSKNGTVPKGFDIPEGIGIEYNGPYYLKEVTSIEGVTYTALMMGKHEEDGQPFTIMTLDKNAESGLRTLKFRIEVIQADLTATEIAANG